MAIARISIPAINNTRLLIKIARMYYEQDLTQAEIGNRLRISRQKVQRLVKEARDTRVVQIQINPISGVFLDLEKQIEERFHIREAVIAETNNYEDEATVAQEVGSSAATYLLRVLRPQDRVVISWGSSILGMVNALPFASSHGLDNVVVIQGLGGLVDPNHEVHATELVRRLAKALKAEAVILPAPGVAGSVPSQKAHLEDPYVSRTLELGRKATVAFMGIGAPRRDSLLIKEGSIVTCDQLAELVDRGAVGDINLRYFNQRGEPVSSNLDRRVIGLTLDEIRRIDHVVGVAGGAAKFHAIQGALAGKMVDALVTDHVTAQRLLEEPVSKKSRSSSVSK